MYTEPNVKRFNDYRLLVVTEETVEADAERYARGGFDGISCPGVLLSRFSGNPFADVTIRNDADRAALQGHHHLTRLSVGGVHDGAEPVDLSRFENLVELAIMWHPSTVFPREMAHLQVLYIADYSPGRSASLLPAELPSLRRFQLGTGSARAMPPLPRATKAEYFEYFLGRVPFLAEMATMPNIRVLRIDEQSQLTDIRDVERLQSLEEAQFDNCRRLTDYSPLGQCPNLRALSICGSPKVQSIRFLRNCPKMADFHCWDTNIVDGDLTPLIGVEQVSIEHKRHYSHTEPALRELTAHLRRGESIEVPAPAPATLPAPAEGPPALPTDVWLQDLPEGFPPKGVKALHVRLQRFVEDMANLPKDAPVARVLYQVKWVVIDIGEINEYHGDFLDTGAREELVGFIHDMVAEYSVGEWGDDITERWRRW